MAVAAAAVPVAALGPRVRDLVELLAERGYALSPDALGRLLQVDPDTVREAALADPSLILSRGRVAPAERSGIISASCARAEGHAPAAARWRPVALEYARRVARHVPWARAVLLSGSIASGGFEEGDDLDVSIVAAPGTKHLTYAACLALAFPFAWRHRRRAHAREARLPLAPKLVCINVVWTEDEALPFERDDAAMALEIALSECVWGAPRWSAILATNAALGERFAPREARDEIEVRPSRANRLLAWVTRARPIRAALDAVCYQGARALHAWIRWHRRRDPEVAARVARLERTKHPYAILDRPRRRA